MTLKNVNGTWKAIFQNVTNQTSDEYTVDNAPDKTLSITTSSKKNILMMESSNNECSDYVDFDEIDFTNFRYLQSNGSFTNQTPTTESSQVDSSLTSCISIDESQDRIYHS